MALQQQQYHRRFTREKTAKLIYELLVSVVCAGETAGQEPIPHVTVSQNIGTFTKCWETVERKWSGGPTNTKLLHARLKRGGIEAQNLGRPFFSTDAPSGLGENEKDMRAFDFIQGDEGNSSSAI